MSIIDLTSVDVKEIAALIKLRDQLQGQLAQITARLSAFQGGKPLTAGEAKVLVYVSKRRGELKQAIVELLKSAGKSGATVTEIAAKLNSKRGNLLVWFGTTGKRVKEIKKTAPSTYAWVG